MNIVVSNRVAKVPPGGPMTGGLASALLPAIRNSETIWLGSSGRLTSTSATQTPRVDIEPYGCGAIATVDLPERIYAGFYDGYANSALWPLLHSRPDLSTSNADDYACYREMNAFMAKTLATFAGKDATFWIHDYHFLPLGLELRRLGIVRRIGFFLHTPWAPRRVMIQLPQHRELTEAMLAYNLIGFQTDKDRDNFADMLNNDLAMSRRNFTFRTRYGECRLGTYPIGIDPVEFADNAQRSDEDPDVRRLKSSLNGAALIIGVDRIDYSKGIGERLRAFDRLLTLHPEMKRRLSMVQIAVPSRSTLATYCNLRSDLARMVGDINGRHGELDWTPIRYLNKCFGQSTLAGLYRASAVGLVTPFQDGMNLVAKEYVAAQDPDNPGVLVLSRFAGAANELNASLLVDPSDADSVTQTLLDAASMPRDERQARWQFNMNRLLAHPIHRWFAAFMSDLRASSAHEPKPQAGKLPPARQSIPTQPLLARWQH